MKKLFTLLTMLVIGIGSSWGANTVTEDIRLSTIMPGSGVPEYQFYVIGTVNGKYWGNSTQPVNASDKAKFAFYAVPNKTDTYYIYNVTASTWLSYTTATSYGNQKNFVTNSNSLNATAYWKITKTTSKSGSTSCYAIRPYRFTTSSGTRTYEVASKYLNWYTGLGTDQNPITHTSVGLWQDAPTADDGSCWSIVSVPSTDLDMMLSREIVSAETSYKEDCTTTTSSDNLITNAAQLVNTWGDSEEGTNIGGLIDGNTGTFWHTSWHPNASGSYLAKNELDGTNYLEVKDVSEVDLVSFTFTRRPVANDHVTAWSVYGVPDSKSESETSREGLTLLGLFSTPYGSNTETKTSPAFETKGFTRFRFYADQTVGDRGYFHISEFQMHEVTIENTNPKAEKTASAISTAKGVTTATQADVNTIHNAACYYTGPELSDETTKYYYTFKNKRSSKYAAWQNDNNWLVQHSRKNNYLENFWYVTDGTGTNYKMHNFATSKLLNDTDQGTNNSFTDNGADWYIYKSQINTDYWVISKNVDPSASYAWDDQNSNGNVGYWKNISGDANGTSWTIEQYSAADAKEFLNSTHLSWIKTRFIDNIGNEEGQFTTESLGDFKTKYDNAKAVYDNPDATVEQVLEQCSILAAITSYPVPTPVTLAATENVQIRSNYSEVGTSTQTGTGNYIVVADNSVANATWMKWSVVNDISDNKFYWNIVKQSDNTWKLQNVGTNKFVALASGANDFTMIEGEANGTSFVIEKNADNHYAFVTQNTYKYLHARALSEYLGGNNSYYIGGSNPRYWLMPVAVSEKAQNSCNDWDILVVDIGAKDRLGAAIENITIDYLNKIGEQPADYNSESASDIQALVEAAQAVYDQTEGEPDYVGALETLQAGLEDAIEKLEHNGFSNEYVYTIKNKGVESAVLYYDGSNHYANAKNYNTESDKNASNQWAIVTRNGKKYVYNIYAGEFLHGKTGTQSPYSWPLENKIVNAIDITLQDGIYAGTFKLRDVTCTDSYDFMHCNNSNYDYGTTNWCEGSSSSWYIEKVNGVTLTSEEQKEILDKIVTGPIDKAKSVLDKSGNVGYPAVSSTVATELESAIDAVKSHSDDYTTVTDEQIETVKTKLSAFYAENSVVLPENGKAYRISIYKRGSSGAHWNYNADGTRNDGSSQGGTFYVHRISKNDNTRFVLISTGDGKILKSNGVSDHYRTDYAYNDFEVASLNSQSENGNMSGSTPDQRCGYVYMTADARNDDNNNRGNLIVQESNGNTSQSNAPYFNGSYTSAIKFTEVVDYEVDDNIAKVVAQIDALVAGIPSGYTLGEGVGTYFYMNGETKITSTEDYISAINSALSASDVDAIKNSLAINMPAEGFYRFKAAARSSSDATYNWYIGGNADGIYAASTAKDQAPGANTIFYLENDEDGYHLLNYSSGRYSTGISYNAIGTKSNFTLSEGIKTNNTDKLIGEYRLYNTDNNWVIAMWNDGIKNLGKENDWEGWTIEPVDELPLTLSEGGYTSFSAPVPIEIPKDNGEDKADYYAYYATSQGNDAGVINMRRVTGKVPEDTGLIIYTNIDNPTIQIAENSEPLEYTNLLVANVAASNVSRTGNYFFGKVSGKYVFTQLSGTGDYYLLPGHKAYLNLSGGGARMSINWGVDDPTGLSELRDENIKLSDGKYYQNGRVVIVRNGVMYNVAGQTIK